MRLVYAIPALALATLTALAILSPSAFAVILEVRTTASNDDAEEFASGSMYVGSGDLELVHDTSDQTVGMRWVGLAIPKGATISSAWIQFAAKESQSEATSLTFRGQAADAAPTFSSTTGNISTRPRTAASVSWPPTAWTAGAAGTSQRTPDLRAVIQEIVNRPGWASGNPLVVMVTGTGHRTAWAWNGNSAASPLLHVEYTTGGTPPPDQPPVAKLTVTQLASPPLTVKADGSASTDVDATPIRSYEFDFGDGSPKVVTFAPEANATHTYAASGTYVVTLVARDTGGLASAAVSITVTSASSPEPVAVYVGYYDTHHPYRLQPKPDPWKGSTGVVFVGNPDSPSGGWDTSALRLDNLTGQTLSGVVVTVDIGTRHYALWGTQSIPAGGKLILAQTAMENFDGSDTNPAGCYSCSPNDCLTKVRSTVPVVRVTIGSTTTRYYDNQQVLNTRGVDAAGCPYTGTRNDESHAWQQVVPGTAPALSASRALGSDAVVALAPIEPNPARGSLTLQFRLPTSGRVYVGMFDVTGRRVRTWVDHSLEEGDYHKVVDLSGIAPGVYFCHLRTPELHVTRTFVIAR
jgi:PKD repeat protein